MKVLENWMVDLDILPGSSQQELSKQAQAQIGEKGEAVQSQIKEQAATIFSKLPDDQRAWLQQGLDTLSSSQKSQLQDSIMAQLPEDQRAAAKSYLQSAADVGAGALSTLGGGAKGLGDTLGNTVGALAGGLASTGSGMAKGAQETAGMGEKGDAVDLSSLEGAAREEGKEGEGEGEEE